MGPATRHPLRVFACSMGLATVLGSIVPDLDHIFEAIGKEPAGRFAHPFLFAFALFFAGCALACVGGLYVWLVLNDYGGERNDRARDI